MQNEPNGFIRYEDMAPAEAHRMRDAHARRHELNERHPVLYALSTEALPEGVVALIAHDPRSEWPRAIVLSRLADDRALAMADAALVHAEEHAPIVHDRRVLRVTSDGEVSSADDSALRFTLGLLFPGSPGSTIVGPFLRAAELGRVIHIDGIGRARIPQV